jgi:hypothetical protein
MIKHLDKNTYLVNGKLVNVLIPKWGKNLTNKEYKELQKLRLLISKGNKN